MGRARRVQNLRELCFSVLLSPGTRMTKELEHWVPEMGTCFPCVTAGMAIACRMSRMKSAPAVLLSATGGRLCSSLALSATSTAALLSITPWNPGDLAPWSRATLIHRPAFQLLPLILFIPGNCFKPTPQQWHKRSHSSLQDA